MKDKIFEGFVEKQRAEGMALARESDLFDLIPEPGEPPQRYLGRFYGTGLVRDGRGAVTEAHEFVVGMWFPDDYLRRAEPFEVLTWLGPWRVFHPNILPPLVCIGHVAPGTGLVDLLYRIYEIITYNRVTMREDDALNHDACAWARRNRRRFPVDRRPLKRRAVAQQVHVTEQDPSRQEVGES